MPSCIGRTAARAKCLNMEKLWLVLAGGEGSLAIKYRHIGPDLVPFLSCFRGPAHDRNQMLAIQKDIDFAERVLDNGFALQIDAKDAFHGVVLFENAEEAHIARYAVSNVFRIFDVESVLSTQIRRAIPSDKDCCVMVVDDRMEDDETSHVFELGDGFAHKIVNKVYDELGPVDAPDYDNEIPEDGDSDDDDYDPMDETNNSGRVMRG